MKVGDLVKIYGTVPPLVGVVTGIGMNGNFKSSEEVNSWNSNPDVHLVTKHGKRLCRMLTLEPLNESR